MRSERVVSMQNVTSIVKELSKVVARKSKRVHKVRCAVVKQVMRSERVVSMQNVTSIVKELSKVVACKSK
jgi:hypothetical protein